MNLRNLIPLLLLTTTRCIGPTFEPLNTPPPGRTAEMREEDKEITISKGVALGLGCLYRCDEIEASAENSTLLGVRTAYLNDLIYFYGEGDQPKPGVVIFGKELGRTKLFLSNEDGETELEVEIVE